MSVIIDLAPYLLFDRRPHRIAEPSRKERASIHDFLSYPVEKRFLFGCGPLRDAAYDLPSFHVRYERLELQSCLPMDVVRRQHVRKSAFDRIEKSIVIHSEIAELSGIIRYGNRRSDGHDSLNKVHFLQTIP